MLDSAHVGDIRGALGTIRVHEMGQRRGTRARLLALLAIMGPGLIVMVGDNDAGGVATYAQAGQDYGVSLLWVLLLLIPVLIVNQEMVIRLGAVTGVGHARLINERFGRFWGWFSVGDLFVLNFMTIVTEFIGVSLSLGYFGISPYIAVPVAMALLVAITASGSFRQWERFMYVFIAANFLVIPLAILSHPSVSSIIAHTFTPGIRGGATSNAVLLIIAIVGTTVAPWQLFFQQSNIVDKRITPRWINYERTDTVIGAFVVVIGAGALIAVTAFGLAPAGPGHFVNAGVTAHQLAARLGSAAGAMFAIVLLNASLIGAAAVTLATSYAFGDVFGIRHSLHRGVRDAPAFYVSFTALVALAGGIVLIPGAPLGVITTAVQALAGVLLPSATVFLLLLCNDREVLGPWVNRPWLNAVATLIVSVLLVLSIILVITTLFPAVNVGRLSIVLFSVLALVLAASAAWLARSRRTSPPARAFTEEERRTWTMPPLALLGRPEWSAGRRLAMLALRGYLVIAVLLLVVKAVQLGGG
ncbi:MAG TPA: NRAMP family divalent metal transporter [Solirubrobacteraceae bacterium]|nr:NRAMP family divalent metal transporter [Solirubrobacteraceae bacterium]